MAMTLNEYQVLAQRTCNTDTFIAKLVNGVLGLCGEAGECSELLKKHLYQGHKFDKHCMAKELGDVLWYIAEVVTGLGMTMEEIAAMNIEKLKARYPEGFEAERSLHRQEGDV